MRVAITGLSGLLGRYLVATQPAYCTIIGITREAPVVTAPGIEAWIAADLAAPGAATALLRDIGPDAVVHAAGEGGVDVVQGHLDDYRGINVECPREIASYCHDASIPMVFLSSNAVFGGRTREPYADDSPLDPVNDYGRLKAEAEAAVMAAHPAALVLRPLLMYGVPNPTGRSNPALHWVRELGAGRAVRVVDDVHTQPLWARDCAEAVWHGLDARIAGPVNISGGQSLTLHGFARLTAEVFGFDPSLVEAISSATLTTLAPRPATTAYDLRRLHEELGMEPLAPREGLEALRRELAGSARGTGG